MSIILRFVRHDDPASDVIVAAIGGHYSHVEALTRAGTVIGAFGLGYKDIPAGVSERPLDYDGGKWADQKFMLLPADTDMSAKFYHYLRAVIGEPYDWTGIPATVFARLDDHRDHRVFCSALQTLALRWVGYFPNVLPVPAHSISPRDLDVGLTMRPDTRVVTHDDSAFVAHVTGGL